jgi:anti-sigma28 factor (negative regulator of flagellin synthesis)
MKIPSLGQSDAISKYTAGKANAPAKTTPTAQVSDSVELSEGAQKYAAMMKAARDTLDQTDAKEAAKAAQVKARMEAGTYQVSDNDVVKDILGGFPSNG